MSIEDKIRKILQNADVEECYDDLFDPQFHTHQKFKSWYDHNEQKFLEAKGYIFPEEDANGDWVYKL